MAVGHLLLFFAILPVAFAVDFGVKASVQFDWLLPDGTWRPWQPLSNRKSPYTSRLTRHSILFVGFTFECESVDSSIASLDL
jgi:hypothetical protein